jgi:hypothetical protein
LPRDANILLITLDTLRADHLSCYGGKTVSTSNMGNFGVQMELPWKTRLEASYIGNKSKRLNTVYNGALNQVDSKYLSLGDTLLDDISDHPEIKKPYPSFEGTVALALRPFPQYQGVITHRTNIGRGDYHSLQVTASRRSNNLSYLAAYILLGNPTSLTTAQILVPSAEREYTCF